MEEVGFQFAVSDKTRKTGELIVLSETITPSQAASNHLAFSRSSPDFWIGLG